MNFKLSNYSIKDLIKFSKNTIFSRPIQQRVKQVGNFKYLGFKYSIHKNKQNKLQVYIKLYFIVQGAKYKNKRQKYILVVMLPYIRKIKNLKRLYDLPVKLFSSDPSFKYYFAYVLYKSNLLIDDEKQILRYLGRALTQEPIKRNPAFHKELTKHFFKLFQFIANKSPRQYLDDRHELPPDFKIPIKI